MRIAIGSLGFISVLTLFPFVTALCIVALSVRYRAWEAIALGFLMDMLWLPSDIALSSIPLFTIGSIVVVWLFEPLRMQFLH